ncbi:MAG TPA: hypothetical protein EYP53_09255 [Candidatus Latescibacteria bacterium]|nr:hypothetical protein [Candidatus Latescibacterota bacterium]
MAVSSVSGLISGMDWDEIISKLMEVERRPVQLLEARQSDYQEKLSAWQDINTKLLALKTTAESMDTREEFLVKAATSSDEDILTATASGTAISGSYSIIVSQLAKAHKLASQGWADEDSTAVASDSGYFKFKVGSGTVTSVSVTSSTTLLDLMNSINASDGDVTATILNDGSSTNPYRLVLTANDSGTSNEIQITQNDTNLDFSATAIDDVEYDTWTGTATATSGGTYTGSANKTFSFTVGTGGTLGTDTIVINWQDSEGNTGSFDVTSAEVGTAVDIGELSGDGEGVMVTLSSSGDTIVAGDTFSIDVFNPTLQSSQDAKFKVDNVYITKSSNTITDVIEGVTINLKSVDATQTVSLSISDDVDAVKSKIEEFVSSYNDLLSLIATHTSYDTETETAGVLLGDGTLRNIKSRIQRIISSAIPGLASGATFESLSQIGIKSGSGGSLSIDDTKLTDALDEDFDAVGDLFALDWSTTNSNIRYFTRTSETQAGTYTVVANFDAEGNLTDGTINGNAADVEGDYLVGASDNPEEGLKLKVTYAGNSSETAEIRLSLGVSVQMTDEVDFITDPYDGLIPGAEDHLQDSIDYLQNRIDDMERRLTSVEQHYRDQFIALELIMSQLNAQSNFLAGQLNNLILF